MNFAVWLEILCALENCGPYTLHPDWAQTETSLVRDLGIVQLNLRGCGKYEKVARTGEE